MIINIFQIQTIFSHFPSEYCLLFSNFSPFQIVGSAYHPPNQTAEAVDLVDPDRFRCAFITRSGYLCLLPAVGWDGKRRMGWLKLKETYC